MKEEGSGFGDAVNKPLSAVFKPRSLGGFPEKPNGVVEGEEGSNQVITDLIEKGREKRKEDGRVGVDCCCCCRCCCC